MALSALPILIHMSWGLEMKPIACHKYYYKFMYDNKTPFLTKPTDT